MTRPTGPGWTPAARPLPPTARANPSKNPIVSQHEAGTIALVVHGGTIMTILESLEPSHEFYRWQAGNGCGYLCTWDGAGLTVETSIE